MSVEADARSTRHDIFKDYEAAEAITSEWGDQLTDDQIDKLVTRLTEKAEEEIATTLRAYDVTR